MCDNRTCFAHLNYATAIGTVPTVVVVAITFAIVVFVVFVVVCMCDNRTCFAHLQLCHWHCIGVVLTVVVGVVVAITF